MKRRLPLSMDSDERSNFSTGTSVKPFETQLNEAATVSAKKQLLAVHEDSKSHDSAQP